MTNFNKTLIIGLGLLGGSIAKSYRKYHVSKYIFAHDPDTNSLELALKQKIIDDIIPNLESIDQFDVIILCAPLRHYKNIFKLINNKLNPNTILFDIGSVKNFNLTNVPKNFIGCHPIAGSDLNGYQNSKEDLFLNKNFIICPNSSNSSNQIEIISKIIIQIKANPIIMDPKTHDQIYGLISHLPQFLSFLSKESSPKNFNESAFNLAFRLDNSDPNIWQDIFNLNQINLEFFYNKFYDNSINFLDNINNLNFKLIFESNDIVDYLKLNNSQIIFDENLLKFFDLNFNKIMVRFIFVLNYLKIIEIKKYESYYGSGFKDFISIINFIKIYNDLYSSQLSINFKKNSNNIYKIISNIIQ